MSEDNEYIRLDERVKILQDRQDVLEERLDASMTVHGVDMQKIAVLESKISRCVMESKGGNCLADDIHKVDTMVVALDKRVGAIETASGQSQDRWKQVLTFVVQLAWVVLAAWLLTKLNLAGVNLPGSP